MSTPKPPPEVNDIIQLDPSSSLGKDWGPQLCIVDKVEGWGVRCYFIHADTRGKFGAAYLRVENGTFAVVGRAEWGAID